MLIAPAAVILPTASLAASASPGAPIVTAERTSLLVRAVRALRRH